MVLPSNVLGGLAGSASAAPANGGPPPSGPICNTTGNTTGNTTVCVNLTLKPTAIDLSSTFWGTTISPRARLLPNEATLVNATPTQIIVWPGGGAGDDYNPITNRIYTSNGHWTKPVTSEADFVAWCKSVRCQAIFQVPAEIDEPGLAAAVVNYTLKNLSFTPTYWEIGNEPELWHHTGVPWGLWQKRQLDRTYPAQYAEIVQNYTKNMTNANSSIKIIGLAATGRANNRGPIANWIDATIALNGENLSGVAYHSYPAAFQTTPKGLPDFYGAINGSAGLVGRVGQVRSAIMNLSTNSTDRKCLLSCLQHQQIFVTEVGSALSSTGFHHWSEGFPGALDLAAQFTQAMDLNLTNLDLFGSVSNTSNSWLSLQGSVRPDYTLYTEILNHLGTIAYPVNITTPTTCNCTATNTSLGSDLYGIATRDPAHADRSDLMVVNLNATTNVTFQPGKGLPGIFPGTSVEVWQWQGNLTNRWGNWSNVSVTPFTSQPVAQYFPNGLPSYWTLPLQSMVLFEAYPSGGAPVQFNATFDLPNQPVPRWYVDVGGTFETSNGTSNLTFFLPRGEFDVTSPAIPLNHSSPLSADNNERTPKERLEPFLASTITVATSRLNESVVFAHQWSTNISAGTNDSNTSSGTEGYVTPAPSWWNESTPLTLTEHAGFHYVFVHWEGFGNGSNTSLGPRAIIAPTSWIAEKAIFAWGYPVTFTETGLPSQTDWSVTVQSHFDLNGTTYSLTDPASSVSNALGFEEANGTYRFTIGTVPGYRANLSNSSYLTNSSFSVSNRSVVIPITFTAPTLPAPRYEVTFEETGLPMGTRWWLTTRNVTTNQTGNVTNVTVSLLTNSSLTPTMMFEETNGSYGYNTSSIPGFRAHPPAFGYNVSGPGRVVLIQFSPVRYYVIWKEVGLGPNLSWSVTVNDGTAATTNGSVGAWTTLHLVNGTYSFLIPKVSDYVPVTNESGTFTVNGANVSFDVLFPQVSFPVTFAISGLPPGTQWQVRLSDSINTSSELAATFQEPNGSYTYDVEPPAHYLAYPSHGTVTVDAAAIVITVSIVPAGPPSNPPLWTLVTHATIAGWAVLLVAGGTLLLVRARSRRRSGENL
jgi:hypothetical protein